MHMDQEMYSAEEFLIFFSFSPSYNAFCLPPSRYIFIQGLEVDLRLNSLTELVKIMDAQEGEQQEVIDHLIICIIRSCLRWDQILREETQHGLKEHGLKEHGLRRLSWFKPQPHLLPFDLGHSISLHFQFSLCEVEIITTKCQENYMNSSWQSAQNIAWYLVSATSIFIKEISKH